MATHHHLLATEPIPSLPYGNLHRLFDKIDALIDALHLRDAPSHPPTVPIGEPMTDQLQAAPEAPALEASPYAGTDTSTDTSYGESREETNAETSTETNTDSKASLLASLSPAPAPGVDRPTPVGKEQDISSDGDLSLYELNFCPDVVASDTIDPALSLRLDSDTGPTKNELKSEVYDDYGDASPDATNTDASVKKPDDWRRLRLLTFAFTGWQLAGKTNTEANTESNKESKEANTETTNTEVNTEAKEANKETNNPFVTKDDVMNLISRMNALWQKPNEMTQCSLQQPLQKIQDFQDNVKAKIQDMDSDIVLPGFTLVSSKSKKKRNKQKVRF